jgi:hypothetical protein
MQIMVDNSAEGLRMEKMRENSCWSTSQHELQRHAYEAPVQPQELYPIHCTKAVVVADNGSENGEEVC